MERNTKRNDESKDRVSKIFNFDLKIFKENFSRLIPFVLFLSLLILLYISNKYYAEETILELNKLKNELKDLRAESLTIKAELMDKTKQSEVADMVEEMGLKEPENPPKKIVIDEREY